MLGQSSSTREDDLLLSRLLDHDGSAWRDLVCTYAPLLLGVSRRTFLSYGYQPAPADAEDAVAEVWKNLLEGDMRLVRQCHQRGNLLQTLQVLARHRSVDVLRKRKVKTVPLAACHALLKQGDPPDDEWDPQSVAALVGTLPARERTLVKLFFLHQKKYRQIAELTGIPQNSIGPTLSRALTRLRQMLTAESSWPPPPPLAATPSAPHLQRQVGAVPASRPQ